MRKSSGEVEEILSEEEGDFGGSQFVKFIYGYLRSIKGKMFNNAACECKFCCFISFSSRIKHCG